MDLPVLGLLTAITVLGGATPDVNAVPMQMVTLTECQTQAESMKQLPPTSAFDDKGRPILYTFYTCLPFNADFLKEDIDKALAAFKP